MINYVLGSSFILLFLVMVFYKAKVFRYNVNGNYLCLENTNSIKAICAVSVMLHHISNEVYLGPMFLPFQMVGYLMVSVFFFYSGYGLMYSLLHKENYMKSFIKRRMSRLLLPYIGALIIYVGVKALFYGFSVENIINSFISGSPIVDNSWFIVTLLILYLMFWLSFRFIRSIKVSWILFSVLFILLLAGYKFVYWSPSIISFFVGTIWGYRKEYIVRLLSTYSIRVIIGLFSAFSLCFVIRHRISGGGY